MCPACCNQEPEFLTQEDDHYVCRVCGHHFTKGGEVTAVNEPKKGS